ncbi:hypothetical protein ACFC14_18690 [Microbacterium sp. NPDC055988]|uniref:hypothetical protein n=1 Tax=Microbacterium sp. NPDC055988 TaxID=3345671 RepID=UPI0035DDCED5
MRNKFTKPLAILLGVLVGGAGGATLSSLAASGQSTPELPDFSGARYDIQALYEGEPVAFPDPMLYSEVAQSVDPSSVRLLDQQDDSSTYVGIGENGMICLIVYLDHEEWTASASCTSPEQFDRVGVGLRTTGEAGAAEQYLISDTAAEGAFARSRAVGAVQPLTKNLLTVDPFLSEEERAAAVSDVPTVGILEVVQ